MEESSSRHAGLGVCRGHGVVRALGRYSTNVYRVRVQVRYEKLEARGDCRLTDKRFVTIYE